MLFLESFVINCYCTKRRTAWKSKNCFSTKTRNCLWFPRCGWVESKQFVYRPPLPKQFYELVWWLFLFISGRLSDWGKFRSLCWVIPMFFRSVFPETWVVRSGSCWLPPPRPELWGCQSRGWWDWSWSGVSAGRGLGWGWVWCYQGGTCLDWGCPGTLWELVCKQPAISLTALNLTNTTRRISRNFWRNFVDFFLDWPNWFSELPNYTIKTLFWPKFLRRSQHFEKQAKNSVFRHLLKNFKVSQPKSDM